MRVDEQAGIAEAVLGWYDRAARDLPWRAPDASPWGVLVSEIMLQQTPVARVLPVYVEWMQSWPAPADLAAATRGDAVRAWGKLGYPRRALRLHESAVVIRDRFAGAVPRDLDDLLSLPGVGGYTARAVAAFAFGQRHPVVDTNVGRVVARAVAGTDIRVVGAARELAVVEQLLPAAPARAARTAVALMELGALVCTARAPRCAACPLAASCAWRAAGSPSAGSPPVRPQRFAGTDRQVRGLLLDVLRAAEGPVPLRALDAVWADATQRNRALAALITDGLVVPQPDAHYALPT